MDVLPLTEYLYLIVKRHKYSWLSIFLSHRFLFFFKMDNVYLTLYNKLIVLYSNKMESHNLFL